MVEPHSEHVLYIMFKIHVEEVMTGVLWWFMSRIKTYSVIDSSSVEPMRFTRPELPGVKGTITYMYPLKLMEESNTDFAMNLTIPV